MGGRLPEQLGQVGAVGEEPAGLDEILGFEYREEVEVVQSAHDSPAFRTVNGSRMTRKPRTPCAAAAASPAWISLGSRISIETGARPSRLVATSASRKVIGVFG
jgi:hypothetical protein